MSKIPATKNPLRVLVMMQRGLVPPDDADELRARSEPWVTEYDVCSTLSRMGHEVVKIEVHDDLTPLRDTVTSLKPHIAFNMLEGFRDFHVYDQHVVSYMELIQQPYTGCNPRGMTLARDKALTKKIMAYHRIRVPAFAVFPRDRRIVRPRALAFPLLVKSVNVEGSVGIAQKSIVYDDEKLAERVRYIHEALGTYAIAEQFIEGRELYVGIMGNLRLRTFPIWELIFQNAPEDMPIIASEKAKWSPAYQKKWGITTRAAVDLPDGVEQQIPKLCRRIYRVLGLTGYARLDFRMTDAGELFLLEANPNPQIGDGEDFAASARAAGLTYPQLLQQIVNLGRAYSPEILS